MRSMSQDLVRTLGYRWGNNNKKLTLENIDFIESLSNDKKMEIILLYDTILQENKKLLDELVYTKSLK